MPKGKKRRRLAKKSRGNVPQSSSQVECAQPKHIVEYAIGHAMEDSENGRGEEFEVSRFTAGTVVWPMIFILGILLVVCISNVLQYFATKQISGSVEAEIHRTAELDISERILFVSRYYELISQTESSLQYGGIEDTGGNLGLLIVDDLGIYETKEKAEQRVRSAMTDDCVKIPVTDTTSPVYKQQLPAYEVRTDWVCMSIYYYYDENDGRLYSLMYSNEPHNYEGSLARATKELLSMRFE